MSAVQLLAGQGTFKLPVSARYPAPAGPARRPTVPLVKDTGAAASDRHFLGIQIGVPFQLDSDICVAFFRFVQIHLNSWVRVKWNETKFNSISIYMD